MTAPSVREQLTEALARHVVLYGVDGCARCILCGWVGNSGPGQPAAHLAAVLTPVVERIAAERAASELEAAAGEFRNGPHITVVPRWLRARAAALRSQSHTDTNGDQA